MIMKKWPFLISVLLLIGTFGFIQSFSTNEQLLSKKAFAQFPLNLAEEWRGRELGLDERVLDVLKLSDYLMRVYVPVVAQGGEESELSEGEGQEGQVTSGRFSQAGIWVLQLGQNDRLGSLTLNPSGTR